MIVKIKHRGGWVLYDNVEKVEYVYTTQKEADNMDWDELWGDKATEDMEVIALTWRRKGEADKLSIMTQSVYLCNDEGKTIEKLF